MQIAYGLETIPSSTGLTTSSPVLTGIRSTTQALKCTSAIAPGTQQTCGTSVAGVASRSLAVARFEQATQSEPQNPQAVCICDSIDATAP